MAPTRRSASAEAAAPPARPVPLFELSRERAAIGGDIDSAIRAVVESGQFVMGPFVARFEAEIAEYLGVRHAVGVNSGTDALVIALRALGIGAGDEVITTCYSFQATAEAIELAGARPVFCDIDPRTFNVDPAEIERRITPRTKALLPVHMYGQSADMDALGEIARGRGLRLVEDAAQAIGAEWRGRKCGAIGDAGTLSFYPTKNLSCYGDGGLVATDDDGIAAEARKLRDHGMTARFTHEALGYNSRLDAIQAAVLSVKLSHIDSWNDVRRHLAARYDEAFEGLPGLVTPPADDRGRHVYHLYTVRVLDGRRDALRERLAAEGVGAGVYYPRPIHLSPYLADRPCETTGACCRSSGAECTLARAERTSESVLSLPIGPWLAEDEQDCVIEAVKRALA